MLGPLVTRAPRRVLAAGAAIFVLAGILAAGVLNALSLNRYEALGSDSVAAREILAEEFGTGSANVVLLVTATVGTIDDADVVAAGSALTDDVAAQTGVGDTWSYWSENAPETLRSEDRRHALVLAWVPGDADHVRGEILPALERGISRLDDRHASIGVQLGGADEVFRVTAEQSRTDFVTAELIVVPLVALLLWAVYRRLAPALVTLAIGLFSAVTTLAILRVVTMFTEISTFAANVGLILGIGLGVDYGLFMVYRFREERARHPAVADAVRATVAGAGRTVVFSGATVAASVDVLFVFPFPFLSSFAYGGIAVVATAVFGATVILPAALTLLGHRVDRRRPGAGREASLWSRLAQAVMRRPLIAGAAALVAVLGLAAPAVGVNFGAPDDRLLPTSQPVRAMYDTIRADFATEDADALHVVAPSAAPDRIGPYAAELSTIPGVLRVDSAAGAFSAGERTGPPGPDGSERFGDGGDGTWMAVVPTGERLADDPTGLVADVRAAPAPFDVVVGGYPADLTDYRDGVVERLPLVAALILGVTFVLLFLMTGSVIAPFKASVLNLLSLSVMFGGLVWGSRTAGWPGCSASRRWAPSSRASRS